MMYRIGGRRRSEGVSLDGVNVGIPLFNSDVSNLGREAGHRDSVRRVV